MFPQIDLFEFVLRQANWNDIKKFPPYLTMADIHGHRRENVLAINGVGVKLIK